MTPRQVDELTPLEYETMLRYAVREQREARRAARAAQRRRR